MNKKEETEHESKSGPGLDQPEDSVWHMEDNEKTVITSTSTIFAEIAHKAGIRAADVALGRRRILASFYAVFHHRASNGGLKTNVCH